MRRALATLLAVLAWAPAAVAAPAPGCAGISFTDGRGDAIEDAFGLGVGPPAGANLDLVAGWVREDEGRLTANIQVADLTPAPPGGGGRSVWTFNWHAGAQRFYVQAASDGSSVGYSYGTYDDASASLRPDTSVQVTGALFGGPDGVVQIDLPARHAQAGVVLERPFAETAEEVAGGRSVVDRAPDAGSGRDHLVGGCLEGGAPAPPAAPAKPKRKAAETLPLRSVTVLGSAKKASKRRSLGFKVRGLKTITGLKVHLTRKNRVVAAGGLRKLRGVRALKLSLRKTVRLREGSYLLRATGLVGQRRLSTVIRVSVRP